MSPQLGGGAGPAGTPAEAFRLFDWSGRPLPADIRVGEVPLPGIVIAVDPTGEAGQSLTASADTHVWLFRQSLMLDEKSGDRLTRFLSSPDAERVPDPVKTIDVFVSYSFEDSALAATVVKALKSRGLDVFIAESSLSTGRQWREQIREAVRSSRAAVLLLTRASCNSTWVLAEAGALASQRVPTIVLFDGLKAGEIPGPLRNVEATEPAAQPDRWLETAQRLGSPENQAGAAT